METDDSNNSTSASQAEDLLSHQFSYDVGDYSILIERSINAEILDGKSVDPLPFSPDWCAGLTSSRSEIFPVINMQKILLSQPSHPSPKLLLLRHAEYPAIVLTCDGYSSQSNIPNKLKTPSKTLPAWIAGTLNHKTKKLLVADHARLFRQIQGDTTW